MRKGICLLCRRAHSKHVNNFAQPNYMVVHQELIIHRTECMHMVYSGYLIVVASILIVTVDI